ncbi:MAG: response regulator transcription factor [Sphingomonadaceae bacterium]|nr:response regulator transcription factor [Sphingomonadaceae bacterium]
MFQSEALDQIKAKALDQLTRSVDADGNIFVYSTTDYGVMRITHHFSDVARHADDHQKEVAKLIGEDPIFNALTRRLADSSYAATNMSDLPNIAAFRKSETYRIIYEQHELRQLICGVVVPIPGTLAVVAFYRRQIERSFVARDVALIETILPMLGETIRRIALAEALVGKLGTKPVTADLTIRHGLEAAGFAESIAGPGTTGKPSVFERPSALNGDLEDADSKLDSLSPREREIAHMVSEGQTNLQIASQAGISRKTVEIHVSAILHKLSLNNRTELAFLIQALNAQKHQLRAYLGAVQHIGGESSAHRPQK